jgi:hypothetical protein
MNHLRPSTHLRHHPLVPTESAVTTAKPRVIQNAQSRYSGWSWRRSTALRCTVRRCRLGGSPAALLIGPWCVPCGVPASFRGPDGTALADGVPGLRTPLPSSQLQPKLQPRNDEGPRSLSDRGPSFALAGEAEDTRFELVRGCPQHAFQLFVRAVGRVRHGPDLQGRLRQWLAWTVVKGAECNPNCNPSVSDCQASGSQVRLHRQTYCAAAFTEVERVMAGSGG